MTNLEIKHKETNRFKFSPDQIDNYEQNKDQMADVRNEKRKKAEMEVEEHNQKLETEFNAHIKKHKAK